MTQITDNFLCKGGVDLESPFYSLPAGYLRDGINYEVLPSGGYRRIKGYTLYDGKASSPAAPAGSGGILGVWIYQGIAYCFRNNAGATAAVMYKAGVGGWTAVTMPACLKYKTGLYAFQEGDAIVGGTSAATATVVRASQASGSISGTTLAGTLTLSNVVGTFQNNEAIKIAGVTKANANGANYTYSIPPGGSYRFWNYNFLGNASSQRMYAANGVGEALEWDGTKLFPIDQQSGTEWPSLVVGHNDHLFLGFRTNGILRSSSLGAPRDYLSTTGAADIGTADTINDMRSAVGGVLIIGGSLSTQVLYGSDSTNWLRKKFSDNGVRQRSMKEIGGTTMICDSRGVQRVDQTQAFGDFLSTSVSVPINRNLLPTIQVGTASCSVVSRNKDQYRLFFGRAGYYFTFNAGVMVGVSRVVYSHDVAVSCEGLDANNNEFLLFGDSSGNVFQMDSTNKFNGAAIVASLNFTFTTQGGPTRRKHYRKITLYVQVDGQAPTLNGQAQFDLADGSVPNTSLLSISSQSQSGTQWDVGQWDTFQWAGDAIGASVAIVLDGTGQNMGLSIYSGGSEDGQHTFLSGVIHYSPRRLMR